MRGSKRRNASCGFSSLVLQDLSVSAIVHGLINGGHQVLGLARNDAAADALARLGVEAHRGDLSDTASLAAGCESLRRRDPLGLHS